jgi:hypothetical protein
LELTGTSGNKNKQFKQEVQETRSKKQAAIQNAVELHALNGIKQHSHAVAKPSPPPLFSEIHHLISY